MKVKKIGLLLSAMCLAAGVSACSGEQGSRVCGPRRRRIGGRSRD